MKATFAVMVLVLLPGCISLGQDAQLTEWAKQEWLRSNPPEKARHFPIKGHLCIGSPAVAGGTNNTINVYVPWPWNKSELMSRTIMRYEFSKAAYQLHGQNLVNEGGWIATPVTIPICMAMWVDALFHFPTSELHSWYFSLFPPALDKQTEAE